MSGRATGGAGVDVGVGVGVGVGRGGTGGAVIAGSPASGAVDVPIPEVTDGGVGRGSAELVTGADGVGVGFTPGRAAVSRLAGAPPRAAVFEFVTGGALAAGLAAGGGGF